MLSFTVVDLFAATVNAFNGGLLAQRPDHYKRKYFTAVGILVMAIFGGIGGGITRDVLLNEIPGAITDARYLWLCLGAGVLALFLAFGKGQNLVGLGGADATGSRAPPRGPTRPADAQGKDATRLGSPRRLIWTGNAGDTPPEPGGWRIVVTRDSGSAACPFGRSVVV